MESHTQKKKSGQFSSVSENRLRTTAGECPRTCLIINCSGRKQLLLKLTNGFNQVKSVTVAAINTSRPKICRERMDLLEM